MAKGLKLNRIKVVLAEKDIDQVALAKMVGKNFNTIWRICNNATQPSLTLLFKIAIALNVNVSDLLTDINEVKRQLKENPDISED
ncbi:MAG: helix-turn-helix transcriptional regulator [Chitinophaga sp.]|uniref:helix-turn-helix transcriptional regulator n=1 Tax=Chitinophaga sp. TaxID=1869181 RepID=UPI0025B806B2|nr:helix-turn-helix transcriptional regulator [Chitinophaga sp.]MBV8256068.1 helix-turn-helix transcriptional regulator [Chitinophaga sp.]